MFGLFGKKKPSKKSDFEIDDNDEEEGQCFFTVFRIPT